MCHLSNFIPPICFYIFCGVTGLKVYDILPTLTYKFSDILNGEQSTVDQSTAESMDQITDSAITLLDEVGDTETPPPPLENEPVEIPKKKRAEKR